jgi:hypothetical protein
MFIAIVCWFWLVEWDWGQAYPEILCLRPVIILPSLFIHLLLLDDGISPFEAIERPNIVILMKESLSQWSIGSTTNAWCTWMCSMYCWVLYKICRVIILVQFLLVQFLLILLLLHAIFLFSLLFSPEDGGGVFLWNVHWLLDCMLLNPRRWTFQDILSSIGLPKLPVISYGFITWQLFLFRCVAVLDDQPPSSVMLLQPKQTYLRLPHTKTRKLNWQNHELNTHMAAWTLPM